MIKRLTWFVAGAVAGVAGMGAAKRKVRSAAADLAPAEVVRRTGDRLRDAVSEGRRAMRAKEAELRARLDGGAESLDAQLGEGDEVLVDGVPVEPGQVIVLRQVPRDERRHRRRA